MPVKAKESLQIQKARKKIKEQLKSADEKMNPQALSGMSRLIKEQLNRQKPGRINLKKHQITSLEENPRFAKTQSKFIIKLIDEIKLGRIYPKNYFKGRVKSLSESPS